MNTPFLEYELLSPETADPVIMRISRMSKKSFPAFIASNGIILQPLCHLAWVSCDEFDKLYLPGEGCGGNEAPIPLADWPAVKQAIRELNEAKEYEEYVRSLKKLAQINKERDVETKKEEEKKRERFRQLFEKTERDMKNWPEWKRNITLLETSSTDKYKKEKDMKEDRYEFPLKEWEYTTEPEPFELPAPTKLILTRKKPKVEDRENTPVKVDRYYSLYGSWEQFSNFWDAVHYYANNSESRRSPVIASTPQYVRVKEEDYVVFATIVTASGLKHHKSPGPYVEALEDRANGGKG